ncbi:uncharacterized protein A1O5_05518 [Cladophialophora psammophila CBS 110553]|uniref:Zn(2)-C6 fungal-type domain-containing protein n=1 Tax=Cladophialophora psammophila CBS 110553 TaxID=1182543 RepID=W9X312_9EURO|nr:uncharacterized protein A1O5_05518 [Cladophialophora psammophila CBS 110553]EXJ71710.1 hypothetical protein A1O5_05518 [Cladophialophora psammophila CBS 110553]
MPPRRSHQKSRRGCLTCKYGHIKCDESGPPCGRCKLRATTCEYASPGLGLRQPQALPLNHDASLPTKQDPDQEHLEEPLFPKDHRLLELQLMHRWSTVTYKSLRSKVAGDDYIWQIAVPRWSLQHDFLRTGLFALSAFEVASRSTGADRAKYLEAAVEYQTLALSDFRHQLQHQGIDPQSCETVLCFSLMLMVLALASSQFITDLAGDRQGDSMVLNTITHFELLRGCGTVLGDNAEQFLAQNSYAQKLTPFEKLTRMPLDPDTAVAMSKLNSVNERRILSTVGDSYEHRAQHVAHFEACRKAITLLEECFAKCVGHDDDHQGYILGWLNMAGEEYIHAIKGNDRVALLVLMYWGSLVEKLSHQVWWARDFGRLLVEEISGTMCGEADALTTDIVSSAQKMIVRQSDDKADAA